MNMRRLEGRVSEPNELTCCLMLCLLCLNDRYKIITKKLISLILNDLNELHDALEIFKRAFFPVMS